MLKSFFEKVKVKLNQHFKVKNLVYNLVGLLKINLIISIDDIYNGTKNPKRFRLCVLNYILHWLVCLYHFPLLINDYMYSLINSPFFTPELIILVIFFLIHVLVFKSDILFGEINCNLSPFKICYFLAKDIKLKHKLSEKNYNRLAILLRICMIGLIYYGIPIISLGAIIVQLILLIKGKQLFWLFNIIIITPFYVNGIVLITSAALTLNCLLPYYKIRFDQLHHQIKSIIPNGTWKFITKREGKLLLDLIHEHNELAVEIDKLNMMMRRSVASCFINFSFMKIISLYLMFNTKDLVFKLLAINILGIYLVFGLAISYLLSHQIKSAHQTLKFMNFVVCNYKMEFKLRLKV